MQLTGYEQAGSKTDNSTTVCSVDARDVAAAIAAGKPAVSAVAGALPGCPYDLLPPGALTSRLCEKVLRLCQRCFRRDDLSRRVARPWIRCAPHASGPKC